MLDIGGGSGKSYEKAIRNLEHVNYTSLDFVAKATWRASRNEAVGIVGNIQKCNAHIPPSSFQIVMALNVFEHLAFPWIAAREMIRLVVNGGLLVVAAPFSWRYHGVPIDTFRYTHTALRILFESSGGVQTLYTTYSDHGPRKVGQMPDRSDVPPNKNYLTPNVEIMWVGRRMDGLPKLDPDSLDHSTAFSEIRSAFPDFAQWTWS